MQEALIQRYLGNKSLIVDDIVRMVSDVASPGDYIFDAFAGSLAVTAGLRNAGFPVIPNDINHFSWTLARAYFSASSLPKPVGPFDSKLPVDEAWRSAVEVLTAPWDASIPENARRSDIWEHYCEEGPKSAFVSKRGQSGRRRFFSAENAQTIDRALSRIRYWHRADQTDELTRCLLTASLLTSIEKVSNTQGTYHDFPRGIYDARSLKPLRIRPPKASLFQAPCAPMIGKAQDSLQFAASVPRHKVLYLDPPYNFRQYTSYYFMLNLVSAYAELDDLDGYFERVEHVRGQNMADDFKSTFCSKSQFIPSLRKLVERSDAEYVILSYFDGRNHWGEFKKHEGETTGRELLEEFFADDLFTPGSLRCEPVRRLNYQSYGGYTAKQIQEFLFIAEKASSNTVACSGEEQRWTGTGSVYETMY